MNKPHNVLVEIFITFIAASVVSLVAYFLAIVVLQFFDLSNDRLMVEANMFGLVIFGVAVGYRLNDIVRLRKKR